MKMLYYFHWIFPENRDRPRLNQIDSIGTERTHHKCNPLSALTGFHEHLLEGFKIMGMVKSGVKGIIFLTSVSMFLFTCPSSTHLLPFFL